MKLEKYLFQTQSYSGRKEDVLSGFLIKQDKWFCACWTSQARVEKLKTLQELQESWKLNKTKNSRYLQRFQERERVPVTSRKLESKQHFFPS